MPLRLGWWRSGDPSTVSAAARMVVGAAGAMVLGAGAVAVFATANSGGSAALVAAGTVLLALGLFANRVESVEGAGVKLQLRAVETAAKKLEEASQADEAGDPARAEDLRTEARQLLAAVQPMAASYEQLRLVEPGGRKRTEQMNSLVRQARAMAKLDLVDARAVRDLFESGSDGNRIMAIGLMRGAPGLANLSLVVEVIRHPRSGFEQWQALRLAQELLVTATPADQTAIREAIEFAESSGSLVHGSDTSRLILANQIRAKMEGVR